MSQADQTASSSGDMIPAMDVSKYLKLFGHLAPLIGSHCDREISLRSCNLVAEILDVTACSILLPNHMEKTFYLGAAKQISREDWPVIRPSMDSSPLAGVYESRQSLLINGEEGFESHFGRPHKDRYCLPSCILTPLLKDNQCLGIISIAHTRNGNPFTPTDVNLLESLAGLIANVLGRADNHNERIGFHGHLQCIFNDLHVGLIVTDPQNIIRHVNHEVINILGYPQNCELEGFELARLLPGTLYKVCKRMIERDRSGGTVSREQVCFRLGDVQRAFRLTVSPMHLLGGRHGDNLIMIKDDGQDHDEVQRIHRPDNIKHSILSIISHELRTPLAVISGSVPMIDPDSGTTIKPKVLRQLHSLLSKNCDRLNEVVNTILDVTEIENGTLELDLQKLDIHEVLEEVVGPLRAESSKKHLSWMLDLDATSPKITADPRRIRQVFHELVSNAIKFSSDGESVDIKTWTDMDRVVVEFTNHGEVIEKSDGEIIFEKFFQCDQTSTRKYGGVGLGLFLAKNLINMQKGDIELSDSGGGGTTFMVSFPRQPGT